MGVAYKTLAQGFVGTSSGALYTAPADTEAVISRINVVNVSGSDATLTVWRNGTTDAYVDLATTTLGASGGKAVCSGPLTLAAGEVIYGDASAGSALAFIVEGLEKS